MRRRASRLFILTCLIAMLFGVPAPPGQAAHQRVSTGYWLLGGDGGILSYGDAQFHGSTGGMELNKPVVGMAGTPSGNGYWLVATDGGIFAFGDAPFHGSTGAITLNQPIVGMAATATGNGYWLVAADGGIFAFGDAPFHGSTGAITLNQPIVGMAATPSGDGYWMVARDGGIFAFGDAPFHGSTGAITLNQPIVGMAATATGFGYWMVARDGGIFGFGDAGFYGSAGGTGVANVTGMMATGLGRGYWLVQADGGVRGYGDAAWLGDGRQLALGAPIVGAAAYHRPLHAEVAIFFYPWYGSKLHDGTWRHWEQAGHNPDDEDIGASFFPTDDRHLYSSRNPAVLDVQMAEIKAAGVGTVVTSWWGRGSWEDDGLALVVAAAAKHGLNLAIHLEPYGGRSPATVDADIRFLNLEHGIREFWLYLADSGGRAPEEWRPVTDQYANLRIMAESGSPSRIMSGAFASYAQAAGFDGIYTYDPVRIPPSEFPNICGQARALRLLCSPSVGPGWDNSRAGGASRIVDREGGRRYDDFWGWALAAGSDIVSITSYNEWHEGTQIEPARDKCLSGTYGHYCYENYIGAYGTTHGDAHQSAYLERTALWSARARR
jgi:hypothetical protein